MLCNALHTSIIIMHTCSVVTITIIYGNQRHHHQPDNTWHGRIIVVSSTTNMNLSIAELARNQNIFHADFVQVMQADYRRCEV
jgi:hypothetical protein